MKKQLLTVAIAAVAGTSQADLMITGIIEQATNSNSPKAVELYATADIADLSVYTLGIKANGSTSIGNTFTFSADAITAGTFITVTSTADNFTEYFGEAADYTSSAMNFNGDDGLVVVLTADQSSTIDMFGVEGQDASGHDWEYTDGWAYRNSAYSDSGLTMEPNAGTFDLSVWTYSGVDALDNAVTNASSGAIMPVAGVVPEAEEAPSLDIGTCSDGSETLISAIQGSVGRGDDSPLLGEELIVQAIVTQDLQDTSYNGYFIQEEDADSDGDATTSEGMFVYDTTYDVEEGSLIRIVGTVAEYNGITQLSNLTDHLDCATGQALPTSASLTLPVASLDEFEQVEGMQVSITNDLVVSDFYGTGYSFANWGQFVVSTELFYQPTEVSEPSEESYNAAVENRQLSSVMIDDGSSSRYPDLIPYPSEAGFSNTNYFRVGYGVSSITGALHTFDRSSTTLPYFVIPTQTPIFDPLQADRTLEPYTDPSANLKVASMNVLNLFNGIIVDGATYFPTNDEEDDNTYGDYRGANSEADYEIQLAKIVAALEAMDADVIGLMEIENDGFDELSSIYALTEALNEVQVSGAEYAFVDPGVDTIGTDAISVGLLYRPSVVSLVGTTAILDSETSPVDSNGDPLFIDTKNRPSLIQAFEVDATGDKFIVSVNHLKSKGSSCSELDDHNNNDGQGNCNGTRTKAAEGLIRYLATYPTGWNIDDVLVLGDLNAYSKEDPIAAFEQAGLINLKYAEESTEEQPYSYSFGGFLGSLDHVLGSPSMDSKLLSIDDWHINSVESDLMDYNTDLDPFNSNDTIAERDPYYSSDHDPVIAAFAMNDDGSSDVEVVVEAGDDDDDDDNGGSLGFYFLPLLALVIRFRRKQK